MQAALDASSPDKVASEAGKRDRTSKTGSVAESSLIKRNADSSKKKKEQTKKYDRPGFHERNFRCDFKDCNKSFTRSEHLQRHQLNHAPKEIYKCARCGKTFVRHDLLQRHTTRHIKKQKLAQELEYTEIASKSENQPNSPGSARAHGERDTAKPLYKNLDDYESKIAQISNNAPILHLNDQSGVSSPTNENVNTFALSPNLLGFSPDMGSLPLLVDAASGHGVSSNSEALTVNNQGRIL